MKIVFTTKGESWESQMDERFGRAEMFLIYDDQNETFMAFDNKETESMGHGVGLQSSKKMMELGIETIITGNGAGGKALDILKQTDIKLYMGAGQMSVKEAYEAYKNNRLSLQY